MKKILGLVVALTVLALGMNVFAAAFTAGNIVIYRTGDGTQSLTNTGNSVFLDEYTQAGTWVQSIMMPTNWYGANAPLITDGGGFAQGLITRSQDGRFIMLTGFGATLGQYTNFSLFSTYASNEAPRVVGLVDGLGNINTTTTLTNTLAEEEIRSAASTDGTNLWFSGATTGIKATTRGSSVSTQVEASVANVRQLNIYSNQLYFTSSTGIRDTTNNPLPTLTNALVAILPGTATNGTAPFGFAFFNLTGGSTPDTLYVAEGSVTWGSNPGAVLKYSLIGGTNWVNSGSIGAGNAAGLAGFNDNAGVHLFITTGGTETPNASGTLYPYLDPSGYKGNPGTNGDGGDANPNGLFLVPNGLSPSTFNVRGVAMVPQGGESPTNAAFANKTSVGPPYGIATVGSFGGPFFPSNFTYSVANFGTANISYTFINGPATWLSASPSSGSIVPGGSLTVNISVNSLATNLSAGLHTGNVIFNPGGVARPAVIQVNAFTVTPTTNFTAIGPTGGPFTPSSQIYVLSNATASALNWTVNTVQPWSTLSASAGSLPGFASTNIVYSFNNAANSLAVGPYVDSLIFSNASGSALLTTINITLQVGFGIFDDFSTYTQNANMVGQNGWVADDDAGQTPYQISGGVLNILGPGNGLVCTAGEEPVKDWSSTTVTDSTQYVYAGMLITVSNAVPTTAPPFAFEVEDEVKQKESVTFEDDAGSPVANGTGGYVWGIRKSTASTWVIGTQARTYGMQYLVIDVGDIINSNAWIFVNPVDNNSAHLFAMTPDAFDNSPTGGGEDFGGGEGAGGWIWGQYGAATVCQPGFTVSKFAMSTNYADVYNFLAGATPPPTGDPFTTWQSNYFSMAELGTASFSGPNADPFGKGMSNTNQFLAGFNPTNATAYLHIISITKTNSGTDIRVDYLGANGDSTYSGGPASRTNVLEFSTGSVGSYKGSNNVNFTSTGQTNILSGGTGLGTLSHMVDPGGATNVPSRYYRVRVLVP
jgi:hypothetical protein